MRSKVNDKRLSYQYNQANITNKQTHIKSNSIYFQYMHKQTYILCNAWYRGS